MLTLRGTLLNVLRREPRPDADNKFEPYGQAQFQTEEILADGQVKMGIQTLGFDLENLDRFKALQGQPVSVPVRAYVSGKGVGFSIEPKAVPEPLRAPQKVSS